MTWHSTHLIFSRRRKSIDQVKILEQIFLIESEDFLQSEKISKQIGASIMRKIHEKNWLDRGVLYKFEGIRKIVIASFPDPFNEYSDPIVSGVEATYIRYRVSGQFVQSVMQGSIGEAIFIE